MEKLIDNLYFDASVSNNLAIINFKTAAFKLMTSLTESQTMMDFIRDAEHMFSVKGLLLLSEPGCLGDEAYDIFIKSILNENKTLDEAGIPSFLEKNTRFRQINILNRFISSLAGYHKMVFVGINSVVVTPFMGAILVADIRLASPKGAFSLAHRKFGLHPSGSLPFFLTHYLGHSKGLEVQLSDYLTAEEAFRLGLVNQILPDDQFMQNCIRFSQGYLKNCRSTLTMTKRLNNFKHRWLQEYQEHENSLMNL